MLAYRRGRKISEVAQEVRERNPPPRDVNRLGSGRRFTDVPTVFGERSDEPDGGRFKGSPGPWSGLSPAESRRALGRYTGGVTALAQGSAASALQALVAAFLLYLGFFAYPPETVYSRDYPVLTDGAQSVSPR
jgi:hypothetical protein